MAYETPTGRGNSYVVARTILAASVDEVVWVAPRKCKLLGIKEDHAVVGGASAAVAPRKITADAKAPGAAADADIIELTSAAIDLTTTANTTQEATLSTVAGALIFQPGDKLAHNFSGTLTGLVGAVFYRFLEI